MDRAVINRLFAIGDIHGCLPQLKILIEEKLKITRDDRVILLGDYIDRGDYIKETIGYIMNFQQKGYDIIPLLGNHEFMLLESVRNGDTSQWFLNGGVDTVRSFGVKIPGEISDEYLNFFRTLRYYYEYGRYLFVHAGFSNNDPFGDTYEMLWTRNEKYSNPLLTGKIIIHGHTPIPVNDCIESVMKGKNVLNIDTGCVYDEPGYGTLTALEPDSMDLFLA